MEIIEAYIKERIVYINLIDRYNIDKVYVDSLDKISNSKSLNDDDHDYVITTINNPTTNISFELPDVSIKECIVTIVSGEQSVSWLAYDGDKLRELQMELVITDECDIHQKQRLFIYLFRSLLFNYSHNSKNLENTVNDYIDMIRVLEHDTLSEQDCIIQNSCIYE